MIVWGIGLGYGSDHKINKFKSERIDIDDMIVKKE